MAHSFGEASMKVYDTLHKDLQLIMAYTILQCEVDFALTEGYRTPEKQFEYYKKGRVQDENGNWIIADKRQVITNIDGTKIKGSHNHNPSIAVDIRISIPGKNYLAYTEAHLAYVAGSVMRIADQLFKEGRIEHKVRWGGDWNKNGDLTDSKLLDMPHFELIKS